MCSEQEKIEFIIPIFPKDNGVEIWCRDTEVQMFLTVKNVLTKSVKDYVKMKRVDWVKLNYNQCVLNGTQIMFTKETEEAITNRKLQ